MIRKDWLIYSASVVTVISLILVHAGCSKKEEQKAAEVEDKGKIEQMTDQAADKAVRKIRTPINKARSTQDFGDDRLESMDKALQQQ
jgi:PBP1b-binding outer membrane lipoprotein LpoB